MEWGLRKVLPATSPEKRAGFARHIIPVIVELCAPSLSDEQFDEILTGLGEVYRSASSGAGEESPPESDGGG